MGGSKKGSGCTPPEFTARPFQPAIQWMDVTARATLKLPPVCAFDWNFALA